MLRGLKILFLFLLLFRFGIQVNSHSVLDVESENPIKTECVQDQSTLTFSTVADVDEDDLKQILVVHAGGVFLHSLFQQPLKLFPFRKPYPINKYYRSDSSPPNLLN